MPLKSEMLAHACIAIWFHSNAWRTPARSHTYALLS